MNAGLVIAFANALLIVTFMSSASAQPKSFWCSQDSQKCMTPCRKLKTVDEDIACTDACSATYRQCMGFAPLPKNSRVVPKISSPPNTGPDR